MTMKIRTVSIITLVMTILLVGVASTQSTDITLSPGDVVAVACQGDTLTWAQADAVTGELSCAAAPTPTPTNTPQPTPTNTPQPTSTPVPTPTPVPTSFYLLPFTEVAPESPQSYTTTNLLSIAAHYRNIEAWYTLPEQMADHGLDCAGPPSEHPLTGLPLAASVYVCREHIMSSLKASGYGMVAFTPAAILDWSDEAGVFRFDMSTVRVSGRDWIDLWVTPYEYNLVLPHEGIGADLNGAPFQSIRVQMRIANFGDGMDQFVWRASVFNGGNEVGPLASGYTPIGNILNPSRTQRTTFELTITDGHLRFGLPDHDYWWVDNAVNIPFTSGIVQLTHHSYNPDKACAGCGNATWHYDNIVLEPATPFTIVPASPVSGSEAAPGGPFTLAAPAPAGAHVRASINGTAVEVRFDGGPWQASALQWQGSDTSKFRTHWMPVPAGTTVVEFRGTPSYMGFLARSVEVWAQQE